MPEGISESISIKNIIMQGGVFGSLQCTTSIDKLAKEVYSRPELLYMYKGVAAVPPLLMVDDILTVSKCSTTASAMSATVNAFIENKKLKLSHKKCCVIHVGKSTGRCPEQEVRGKLMHRENSAKYLGNIFHSNGKTNATLVERCAKAHAILADIRTILQDVPLGKYKTQAGLQLRQSMFINCVLFNIEVWQGMNSTDITMLNTIDHQLMKVICNGHSITPSESYYLETAAIPIKHIITSHRIMYLHNIQNRSEGELVRRVYTAQKNNPTRGDFIELVKQVFQDFCEPFYEEAILLENKNTFKSCIKKKIKETVFTKLKDIQKSHSKIRDIKYEKFKIQPYLSSFLLTTDMTKILFNMRSLMTKKLQMQLFFHV